MRPKKPVTNKQSLQRLPPRPMQYTEVVTKSNGWILKYATDGTRTRSQDSKDADPGNVIIVRPDRGVMWTLSHRNPFYTEMKFSSNSPDNVMLPENEIDWEQEGFEIISGIECARFRGRYPGGRGADLAHEIVLVDLKTGVRHREMTFDKTGRPRITFEVKSIELGSPDPSLFELPAGYSKVDSLPP